ncbi:Squamosa promoter-binding protein-like (SBP domain) transcription factor family protein [Zea mays]|uniref:Squamosa promoter-binding protein-like (SBP domain) transcription factor family protein n=1 Tax=Zea mays TaxID=4577 RepID=A0A1D6FAM1_MAIZE|nr:Squamosa promoter-binding protein-like (SBP domain) transcription factor family protein [Zea mays]
MPVGRALPPQDTSPPVPPRALPASASVPPLQPPGSVRGKVVAPSPTGPNPRYPILDSALSMSYCSISISSIISRLSCSRALLANHGIVLAAGAERRFHLLHEFDDGKKSCRSRLAQHNGRRRKVQPQPAVNGNSMNEDQSLSSTLFLLLKQLSGLESGSSSEQINHPNSLVNLLKNLAAIASTHAYQDVLKNATSISSNDGNNAANGSIMHEQTIRSIPVRRESLAEEPAVKRRVQDFDLNDSCIEEAESRTDKIVFKLFGKEPKDFPVDLREQILNWLSHYPTDMESYIRPGCVILTIYLHLPNWMWDEFNDDPASWIENLISLSNDGFWRTGWLYARVQDCLTLSCNGSLMFASPWQPVIGDKHQRLCVTPIAVDCSSSVKFSVKGFNIVQPTTKLLCVFDEKYLIQEETQMLLEDSTMQQGPQCLTFSCSFPCTSGRGFIEVQCLYIFYILIFCVYYRLDSVFRLKTMIKAAFLFPLLSRTKMYVLRFGCWSMDWI